MNNNLEIDGTEMTAIERARPRSLTPLEMAVQQGASIDTIERLVALQEKMLVRDAEMAFNAAMNRAQTALGPVAADLTNPQTRSNYASYAAIDKKVRPIYGREGLALSFDTGETPHSDMVRVLCYVSHTLGHTRTYHVDMPADGKGARGGDVMTKTHATGAAMSYGMRYLLKYIFNIAIGEDDNDGNDVNDPPVLEPILAAKTIDALQSAFTTAYKRAKDANNKQAMQQVIAAKDKRKAELAEAPKPKVAKISAEQVTRFQTIASKSGASEEDRHRVLWNVGRYDSSKDVTTTDYDAICALFRSGEWAEYAGEKKA